MPRVATFANRGLARAVAWAAAEFFRGGMYILGRNATTYYLGWTGAENALSYSYSTNNGSTWTSAGTTIWAAISGKTASTLYHCKVRAYDSGGTYAELSLDVTTKGASDPQTVVSVVGAGSNPYTGGSCAYAHPAQWEADLTTIAGSANLVTANVELECWLLDEEFLNSPLGGVPCSIEGATTSATCRRHLTAGPGQSFRDKPDRRTARLGYSASSRGAAMRYTSVTTQPVVDLREGHSKVSRLLVNSAGNGTSTFGGWGIHTSSSSLPVYVDQCFVVSGTPEFVLSANYGPHYITNSIFVNRRTNAAPENIAEENNGVVHTNCIFIALGLTPPVCTVARVSASSFTDCALIGATYLHDAQYGTGDGTVTSPVGTGIPSYANCFTDTAESKNTGGTVVGLPSGVTQIALAGLFESTSSSVSVMDLRPASGSALLAAGITGCW